MTIQEAIASQKMFKRKCRKGWMIYRIERFTIRHGRRMRVFRAYTPTVSTGGIDSFSVEDILATDWEIKE